MCASNIRCDDPVNRIAYQNVSYLVVSTYLLWAEEILHMVIFYKARELSQDRLFSLIEIIH